MPIKTRAKLLHNKENATGNSENLRALPSISLREKFFAVNRPCIFNMDFKFQKPGMPESQVDTTTPGVIFLQFDIGKKLHTGMQMNYPEIPVMKVADIVQESTRYMRL